MPGNNAVQIAQTTDTVTIICGVANCGGGVVIRGGKLVRIPPREPAVARIGEAVAKILAEVKLNG